MQGFAKTASRVDALDTQTVPVVGYYNSIISRCVISIDFLQEPFLFLSFYFFSPLSFFIPVPTLFRSTQKFNQVLYPQVWNFRQCRSASPERCKRRVGMVLILLPAPSPTGHYPP
jgi:hypothetical protein